MSRAINTITAATAADGATNLNIDSGTLFVNTTTNNVGIGTVSPVSKLNVYDAVSATLTMSGDNVTQTIINRASTDTSAPRITFRKSRGSIASPAAVATSDNIGDLFFQVFGGTTNRNVAIIRSSVEAYVSDSDISSNLTFFTSSPGAVTPTEKMRIDSSGNVLIGTTNVNPIASRSNGIATGPAGFIALRGPNNLGLALDSNSGSNIAFYTDNGSAFVNAGSITSTGNSTAYNTSSDYRLKTNLEPISNGIDRLKQLPVYRFNWISDVEGNKADGFVAHEAQAIVPECVTGEKDAVDVDGKPIYQGIDQSKIVPLLTAALKEAIAKIETLESKVTALEAA